MFVEIAMTHHVNGLLSTSDNYFLADVGTLQQPLSRSVLWDGKVEITAEQIDTLYLT